MAPSNNVNAVRQYWDYTFKWTDLHHPAEQLRPMMFTFDKLVDECLERLDKISPPKSKLSEVAGKAPKRDLYALLKVHAKEDPKLSQLWTEIHTIPEWVNWDQIRRGQDVFFRYGLPILNVLTFESLLGGMSSARVVETLTRTGGFSADAVRHRLLETLQHILQVAQSLDSIKPGGDGHISSIRVRFLHASVRSSILYLARQRHEYYSIEKLGIPINDLDCIATITTFSTIVIWLGLPRQGIWLREQEINDYLALWRLIAYYMGTPTEPFRTKETARTMMESLLVSEVNPTKVGKILAQNIILGLENTAPTYASKEFMEAMARHLNGDELSDRLGLPRPSVYYRALIYGYCFVVMGSCYGLRLFPRLEKTVIAFRRKLYYTIITDKDEGLGGESFFEFKYVPSHTRTTRLGKSKQAHATHYGIEALAQSGLLVALFTLVVVLGGMIFGLRLLVM